MDARAALAAALMITTATACGEGSTPERASRATTAVGESTPDAGLPGECREEDGGRITVTADMRTDRGRTLGFNRTFVPGEAGAWTTTTELTIDGALLQRTVHRGAGENLEIEVDYGAEVTGVTSARAAVSGGMFAGEIDGRPTAEVPLDELDAATLTMADGSRLPPAAFPADVMSALRALFEAVDAISASCGGAATTRTSAAGPRLLPLSGGGTGAPGHDSDPENSWECGACWGGCSVGAAACAAGASAACVSFGPIAWICEIVVVLGCGSGYLVCIDACYYPGPCCPVQCGAVACCGDGESCLNPAVGLCCSPDTVTCGGQSCCDPTDTCIDSGPNAGTCCPPENVCGNACCGDLDSCVPELSLCCPFGQTACGGSCCPTGSACIDGECCPAERACNGTCCPAGVACNTETNTCSGVCRAGSFWCTDSNSCCPNGTYCSGVPGVCCQPGEYYCDGACRTLSECIG